MQPIISGMALEIICPCGAPLRITMASILYHDALCRACGARWTATVQISQDAAVTRYPEAGIQAWLDGEEPIDQKQLQEDVSAYL